MPGQPNPIEEVAGLTSVSDVSKADVVSWAKANVAQVLADATDLNNRSMAGQTLITLQSNGRVYRENVLDTTTPDDGNTKIRDFDNVLYELVIVTGLDGADGADPGILLTWDTGTSNADPGSGKIRANNASLASATALYISKTSRGGSSLAAMLAALDDSTTSSTKGTLILTRSIDDVQATFVTGTITDHTDYVELAISTPGGATSFIAGDGISFQPSRTGNAGSNGTDGTSLMSRVRVVVRGNIAIASALENGDSVDGVTLTTGDAVLLVAQTAPAENGIYTVPASGAASRTTAFNTYDSMPGIFVSVMEGSTAADTLWQCTSNKGGTINSTSLAFSQFPVAIGFSVHKNGSDQGSVGSSVTTLVTWSTEIYDVGNHFASNVWTPPPGKVSLTFSYILDGTISPGTVCNAFITKNGSDFAVVITPAFTNLGYGTISIEDVANGTDTYGASINLAGSGLTIRGTATTTFFMGHWIGASPT